MYMTNVSSQPREEDGIYFPGQNTNMLHLFVTDVTEHGAPAGTEHGVPAGTEHGAPAWIEHGVQAGTELGVPAGTEHGVPAGTEWARVPLIAQRELSSTHTDAKQCQRVG